MLTVLFNRRSAHITRACLRHQSTTRGPNEDLIQTLTHYMEEEKISAVSNSYKVRAYLKAIDAIGQLHEQVRSLDQVKDLKGVGPRIALRIDAYLSGTSYKPPSPSKTKRTKKLDAPQGRPTAHEELHREEVISTLSSVSGISPKKNAAALYDAGCRSLEDLKKPQFSQMLNRLQRLNVQYGIGLGRVSQGQLKDVLDFASQNISSKFTVSLLDPHDMAGDVVLLVLDPQNTGILPPSGSPDIDTTLKTSRVSKNDYCSISPPFENRIENRVKSSDVLDGSAFSTEIISPLVSRGLVAATIRVGSQKWNGIVRIPERVESETKRSGWGTRTERLEAVEKCQGQFSRAEIYYVPLRSAGAAMIALTGDLQFNIAIRKAASQLGLRLNEYGLWRWRNAGESCESANGWPVDEYGGYWELVASEREEDIFEAVGMEWVPRERRNFARLNRLVKGKD